MKLVLPDSVSSHQDLTAIILEVRDYAGWLSHSTNLKRITSKRTTPQPVLSPAAGQLVRDWTAKDGANQTTLHELTTALETFDKEAQTITITLAAPATGDIKKLLVGWCRQNISPKILVTFQFNAGLLGGMVVRFGSHIFDWSFRRQILANRQAFPEILRRV